MERFGYAIRMADKNWSVIVAPSAEAMRFLFQHCNWKLSKAACSSTTSGCISLKERPTFGFLVFPRLFHVNFTAFWRSQDFLRLPHWLVLKELPTNLLDLRPLGPLGLPAFSSQRSSGKMRKTYEKKNMKKLKMEMPSHCPINVLHHIRPSCLEEEGQSIIHGSFHLTTEWLVTCFAKTSKQHCKTQEVLRKQPESSKISIKCALIKSTFPW